HERHEAPPARRGEDGRRRHPHPRLPARLADERPARAGARLRGGQGAAGRALPDRRGFEVLFDGGDAEAVLAALSGYRNADGGYGHGLEPDLRAPESQPGPALHAFEGFGDVAPVTAPEAAALCDW